jgi:NAD+ synthase (glutamine-hydrolysing)
MNYGFIKAAAATPTIQVADCVYNTKEICRLIQETKDRGAKLVVFPELCITGYTCSDLFWQSHLLNKAKESLLTIAAFTEHMDIMAVVGLPICYENKLYNAAAVVFDGEILGIVPKIHLPNYSEFYEARHFTSGMDVSGEITIGDQEIPFGSELLFRAENMEGFTLGIEICEDLWVPNPPSIHLALSGATIIANPSASDEVTGKDIYRTSLVSGQSARLVAAYIYADAGEGESTTDFVYAGHNIIAENGTVLAEAKRFINETVYGDIDLERLVNERRRMTTFVTEENCAEIITFSFKDTDNKLERFIDPAPFVPAQTADRNRRCEEILALQAMGLKKRIAHTHSRSAVIGISGGLDSTLALLVTVRAFDMLKLERSQITAVTMPGFGTTDRTYENAVNLVHKLGASLREISIVPAVKQHFDDIKHDPEQRDITYENAQARQRTYLLMDIANQTGGMVIGTGDMSELALGWATYNGDHMSMYGVNASVPKTLVRHLVGYYADTCEDEALASVLYDVLDTPVSPELLPPTGSGEIAQKTEDLVGPYELHDFFLYYMLRLGYAPKKILYLAEQAFAGVYEKQVILKWLQTFYRRFFTQQFKRSCLPDGPKVGSVAVSPRGDLRMPSDAAMAMWMAELEG